MWPYLKHTTKQPSLWTFPDRSAIAVHWQCLCSAVLQCTARPLKCICCNYTAALQCRCSARYTAVYRFMYVNSVNAVYTLFALLAHLGKYHRVKRDNVLWDFMQLQSGCRKNKSTGSFQHGMPTILCRLTFEMNYLKPLAEDLNLTCTQLALQMYCQAPHATCLFTFTFTY